MSDRLEGFAIARVHPPGDPMLADALVKITSAAGKSTQIEITPELMLTLAAYFGGSGGHIPEGQRFSAEPGTPERALKQLAVRVQAIPPLGQAPPIERLFEAERRKQVEAALTQAQQLLRAQGGPSLDQSLGRKIVVVLVDVHALRADVEFVTHSLVVRAVVRPAGWQFGVVRPRMRSD
jgi:hypothetical protein